MLKSKRVLPIGFLCLLILCLSFASTAYAQAVVILATPLYPAYQYGGSGNYYAFANKNTGLVFARSQGSSYAKAGVAGDSHYTGPSISKIRILITVTEGYLQLNGAPGCICEAKLWTSLIDLTTGEILYQAEQNFDGTGDYYFLPSGCIYLQKDIQFGHDYECWAGIITRTGSFLGWSSSALAHGLVTLIKVYQCGY